VVIAPDGTEYHGNNFTGSSIGSVYSYPDSTSFDRMNPVEEMILPGFKLQGMKNTDSLQIRFLLIWKKAIYV